MNFQEQTMWAKFMEASKRSWQADPITESRGGRLYFAGGESGAYIMIDPGGLLSMGEYKDAFPHIGDALFIPMLQRQFDSVLDADKYVLVNGGPTFVRAILGLD